jgi:hypothetical protein
VNDDGVPDGINPVEQHAACDLTTPRHPTPNLYRDLLAAKCSVDNEPMFRNGYADQILTERLLFESGPSPEARAYRTMHLIARAHRPGAHICDETCRCPVDGLVLLYHAPTGDHACQEIDCVFASGMKDKTWMPMIARQGARAKYRKALIDAMADQPLGRHPDVAQQHVFVAAFRAIGLTMAAPVDDLGHVTEI